MAEQRLYNALRKEVFRHAGVLKMLVPPERHDLLCKRYLEGGNRPSAEDMRSDVRYLINIGAEL